MNSPDRITEHDLHAFLDGELDAEVQTEIEAWLAEHPDDAENLADWKAQNAGLHGLFDDLLSEPVPSEMTAALEHPVSSPVDRRGWWRSAAAILLLVAGMGSGWVLRGELTQPDSENFVRKAVSAHVVYVGERRHAVEVWAKEEKHLVKWLSKRLKHKLKAPYLADAGFRLVGGRLIEDEGAPAAQFMYEDKAKRRVTLYTRRTRDDGDPAFRFEGRDGISAFYWTGGPLAFALLGEMKRTELLALAETVSKQIQP
jgi:anti-sigma factor RsiW